MSKKLLKPTLLLLLISSLVLTVTGCAEKKLKADGTTAYDLYNENRPDTAPADTGIPSGNLITSGIAGIYEKTVKLEDKYKTSIENNKVANVLEAVRLEQGVEAYKKAYNELSKKDRKQYDKFQKININMLEVAVEYGIEAAKLAFGIMNFDYKKYMANPMAAFSTLEAIDMATDQILYTEKALEFMVETRSVYVAMLEYKGR
jgi:hypothetical protein